MSRKQPNPFADTEMIRAYHVERRELENLYDVDVVSEITTAVRPDRILIKQRAYVRNRDNAPQAPLCTYTMEWPNAQAMSMPAALFRSAVMLSRLVCDSMMDFQREMERTGQR